MNILPANEPVKREFANKLDVWVYGEPQSGKTHLASTFPNAFIMSTDGNFKNVTSPAVHITSEVTYMVTGTPVTIHGWEYTKMLLLELKQANTYQTIVVDLLEDFYELCRDYHNKKAGVTHESEIEWSRGYSNIRNDFYQFIKDLKALPMNMVLLSHTKDDTGAKGVPVIKPNLTQKVMNKVTGYVDLVGYQYRNDDGTGNVQYALSIDAVAPFATNRWNISQPNTIFSDYNNIVSVIINSKPTE